MRPILLTAVTSLAGFLPLLLAQDPLRQPDQHRHRCVQRLAGVLLALPVCGPAVTCPLHLARATPLPQRQRRLILHAGTHKTAPPTSSPLLRSRDLLAQQNLQYRFPAEDVSHFKSLSHDHARQLSLCTTTRAWAPATLG